MRSPRIWTDAAVTAAAAVALTVSVEGQADTLALIGDSVPGVGTITEIHSVEVNDNGDWMVQVGTDHPDPAKDTVLLKNGAIYLQEGDPIPTPSGVWTGSFEVDLNDNGESVTALWDGLLFNKVAPIVQNQVTTAGSYSPGSFYASFRSAAVNDARRILLHADIHDPSSSDPSDQAIMLVDVDAAGNVIAETKLVKWGDTLPGITAPVVDVAGAGTSGHLAINDAGDTLCFVEVQINDFVLLLNGQPYIAEGDPSPVFGIDWLYPGYSFDISDSGDVVLRGALNAPIGQREVVVWNNILVAREGYTIPTIDPYTITSLGNSRVSVDDAGRVLWFADWNAPDFTQNSGIFRDHELVVQEGVTLASGEAIGELGHTYDMKLSDSGRYLVFEAMLEDGREGAFLMDIEAGATPYAGCVPNTGTLIATGGFGPGETVTFHVDNGQRPGVYSYMAFATSPVSPCGITVPGAGEVLVDMPFLVDAGVQWTGLFPSFYLVQVPDELTLVGATFYTQGAFLDLDGVSPTEPVRLTNGVEVKIGP